MATIFDDLPPESVQRALRVQRYRNFPIDPPPDRARRDLWAACLAAGVLIVLAIAASVVPTLPVH